MKGVRNGFTLVEVVVALFIFALLAAAGVSLLSFAVRAQGASARALEHVSGERRLSALLISDLGEVVPRVSRDASGRVRPAFVANLGSTLLGFVRGGEAPRYVELRLQDGNLVRAVAPFVDGAPAGTAVVLETGVEQVRLRFRAKADWQDGWDTERSDTLPRAVEITITRAGEPPVTRMFLVGAGA